MNKSERIIEEYLDVVMQFFDAHVDAPSTAEWKKFKKNLLKKIKDDCGGGYK